MSFMSPSASLTGWKILYIACLFMPFASHAEHTALPDVTVEGSQKTQPISLPSIQQARDRLNLMPGGVDALQYGATT